MHRRTPVFVTSLLAVAHVSALAAQTSQADPTDVQSRFGVTLNVDLPKKLAAGLEYELRMVDDASAYRGSYVTGELAYAPRKSFTVFASYRLARITEATAHRYGIGTQFELKATRRTTVSFRPGLQYQKRQIDDDGQRIDETTFLRTRLRGKYDWRKRVAVYGSVEPFFTFAGEYPIDSWRNTAGVQYEFAKNWKIDVHYSYRPDYARIYNRVFHVLGADLAIDTKFLR